MGSSASADNVEVEHESGLSRLGTGMLLAFCGAPLMIIGACILLGWNEQRAVCEGKAINQGRDRVLQLDCDSRLYGDGELVMFSCDLQKDGLSRLTVKGSDFQSLISYAGTGLHTQAEMYQCVEHVHSESKKDSVGGGKTTVKTYTYTKEWVDHHVDSSQFAKKSSENFRQNCGVDNPPWPAAVPATSTQYGSRVKVGAYNLDDEFIRKVPLKGPVMASSVPDRWRQSGSSYTSARWEVDSSGPSAGIGQVRVSFLGNDWDHRTLTVLGKNSYGTIERWTASKSWLCSSFTLADLREGVVPRDRLFEEMKADSRESTWILRAAGLVMMWMGFAMLAAPLGVIADCIPLVGPCLGDSVQAIGCCIAAFPALACTLGVIGAVWIAMRPMVGGILLLIFILAAGITAHFKATRKAQHEFAKPQGPEANMVGVARAL